MNFKPKSGSGEPEINLIPFIDVLLVVLIFLMLSTTYARFAQMKIQLPSADMAVDAAPPKRIELSVGADGSYGIGGERIGPSVDALAKALAAAAKGDASVPVSIGADAQARHQAVMGALAAAQKAGLSNIAFEAQAEGR